MPRRRVRTFSSSVRLCTPKRRQTMAVPPPTERALISLVRRRREVRIVATSSISPSRSSASISSEVEKSASGVSAQVTLTQRPFCAGSCAFFAFGQSLRWTDTP